jgi:flagellin
MIKADAAGTTATALVLTEAVPASAAVGDKVYNVTAAGVVTDTGATVSAISTDRKTITLSAAKTWLATDSFMFGAQGLATDILSTTGGDLSLAQAAVSANLTSDTAATATTAFQMVQRAANAYVVQLGKQRSLLGAYQNQMEFTLANITELSSNLSSARSRVIDTDYASETAALTRGQILQQAATAMLAQANQMPNVILTLLK